MPTFNRAAFLSRSIESVQKQEFADWELLIVDDGSGDNTKEIIDGYSLQDNRIKYFYQDNQKASVARNLGLKNAAGKYICFIDSDDEYKPGHLDLFYQHITGSDEKNGFLYTIFRYQEEAISFDHTIAPSAHYDDEQLNNIMKVYLPYSPPVQTICIPAAVKDIVKFDARLFPSECYDFCARCAAIYPVTHLPVVSVTLHGHSSNSSIPRNVDQMLAFNTRQFEEFTIMKQEAFYNKIAVTSAFKSRYQSSQLELAKGYAKKKQIKKAFTYAIKGVMYKPNTIFSIRFLQFSNVFIKNLIG